MSDTPPLPLDADGYVDLDSFDDGDPDLVLDEDTSADLRRLFDDDLAATPDVELSFVEDALGGSLDDLGTALVPDDAWDRAQPDEPPDLGGGPFDLSEYDDLVAVEDTDGDADDALGEADDGEAGEEPIDPGESSEPDGELEPATYDEDVAELTEGDLFGADVDESFDLGFEADANDAAEDPVDEDPGW